MLDEKDVVIIGAGQAGLAASYLLKQRQTDHVVLERGKIGESWRSQRWDSFYLNTPNWINSLPGLDFVPEEPHAFCPGHQLVSYFNQYAGEFDLPIHEDVEVTSLRHASAGFLLTTSSGQLQAKAVILANGSMTEPNLPSFAEEFPEDVRVFSAGNYKNPSELPEGGILVVGTGQSGCQITEDLLKAGRRVYVCASKVVRSPRGYRGKDILYWMKEIGTLDIKLDELEDPAMQYAAQPQVSGTEGGHTVSLQSLARDGATLLGRALGVEGHRLKLRANLLDCIDFADQGAQKIKEGVDQYIEQNNIDADFALPDPGEPDLPDLDGSDELTELDLRAAEIHSVVFCTGFHGDWSWIHLDILDGRGSPRHEKGITPIAGLYCLGYPWLSKRKSGILCGVAEDAEYIVGHLSRFLGEEGDALSVR